MNKRLIAFLLAFLLVADMMSGSVFAAPDTAEPTETTETTAPSETTLPTESTAPSETTETTVPAESTVPAETEASCPYCEMTVAEDGTVSHASTCNTLFAVNASGDIGRTAAFNMAYAEVLYAAERPNADFNYDATSDGYSFRQTTYDPDDPAFVEITNWCWEVSGPTLWYQVKPLAGETLPAGLTADSWILQRYTNDADPTDTLVFVDTGMIGTYVRFQRGTALLYETLTDAYYEENARPVDGTLLSAMVVTDLFTDGVTTWYYVDAAEGETWPEAYGSCHYVPAGDMVPCDVCDVCGKPNCTTEHIPCDVCGKRGCEEIHLFCLACNKFLCGKTHTYCSYCDAYDCTIDHLAENQPVTDPVLPVNPTLPQDVDVAILDELGEPVTGGLALPGGCRTSISAWPAEGSDAAYQWQIRYDSKNDKWTDIQGANEQGILVSPAMFRSILELQDTTAIRCAVTAEGETRISDAIAVSVLSEGRSAYSLGSGSESLAADTSNPEELKKAYVVVQYVYADGRTATQSEFSAIIPGNVHEFTYTVGKIPGYKATLKNAETVKDHAILTDAGLEVSYASGELAADSYVTFTVEYVPDYVDITVIHKWQNIDNSNYTEHERETISNKYKTGEQVTDVHKNKSLTGEANPNYDPAYDGFYHLLYETPTAAADGSTIIEVYYDRNYYLMTFELGSGGYGSDPVYAAFGTPIQVPSPVRPGYSFAGWKDAEGNSVTVPATMPAGNNTYYASWTALQDTQYTVSYWIVNDDGTRSLIGTHVNKAATDTTVSGEDNLREADGYICNEESEHIHSADCYSCGLDEHDHLGTCYGTLADNNPGNNGIAAIHALENGGDPESGYIYVIQTKGGNLWPKFYLNGKYYTINNIGAGNTAATEYQLATIIVGDPLAEKTTVFTNETLTVTKYKAKTTCGQAHHTADCKLICSDHQHTDDCYFKDRKYLEYQNSVTITKADGTSVTYATDKNVVILGDGTSVVNVYYRYKLYTLRFYYAATTGGRDTNGDNINDTDFSTIKIVGGTTYYFGSEGPDTANDEDLLENEYWNYSGQWGSISALPTLNATGSARNYTHGAEVFTHNNSAVTYHYISFHARYGDDISDMWPCSVFNSATRTDKNNANGWSGKEAFVSAWNGEHHVRYSQENSNQTIKGVYERLDEKLLFHSNYTDESTVSYLCFWENGANIGWSVPELYRYNIYLQTYSGQDLTGKSTITRNGTTYYLADSYDTCDNSTVHEQTQVSLLGYTPVIFNTAAAGYDKDTFEYKRLTGTTDAAQLQQSGYYDSRLYKEGYEVNFYYNANTYKFSFWNHSDYLTNGTGSTVAYNEPLKKYFDGITVNGTEYEGANDLIAKPEYYPATLEPDAYEFEGWYTSAQFEPETKVNPDTMTMPNENLMVYAHWIPVTYTVRFFIDKDATQTVYEQLGENYARFQDTTVSHRQELTGLDNFSPEALEGDTNHPYQGYDFVGWFYINEETGEEKAFLTGENGTLVTQNLDLYAKWSSNTMCKYNIYFALDNDKNNQPDKDANGNILYIADPISGSGIAGHTYTFSAKGGDALYTGYEEGYFPTTGSHSLVVDIADKEGSGDNAFFFLYRQKESVPYTVRYVNTETGDSTFTDADGNKYTVPDKQVTDNKNVIITENYQYIPGYMPNPPYQQMLIVEEAGTNIITFYYVKDEVHAPYVVNYYIQELNADLSHKGWSKYDSLDDNIGVIGNTISANAITIGGFTLSTEYTNQYNRAEEPYNGMTGNPLPTTPITPLTDDGTLSGKLSDKGMELNFYYTRNLYPYEFRYMLNGTTTELAKPVFGKAGYDTLVTEAAKPIQMDLDGDGVYEDYQLYEPAETTKDIRIKVDGQALASNAQVTEGQATVNVATFYYVRCTQAMTITKNVVSKKAWNDPDPDPDQEFHFSLQIHANNYHRNSYNYTKSDGTTGTLSPVVSASTTLQFTLKNGEFITIDALPTAEYTITELDLPTGYYDTYAPAQTNTLTVNTPVHVTVTNTYEPANLTISKTVNMVEENGNLPEVESFVFTIDVPDGVTGSYDYVIGSTTGTATVAEGKMTIALQKGQTATFYNLPVGEYTITETDYSAKGYSSEYTINGAASPTQGTTAAVTMVRGETQTVDFVNRFPVGTLLIEKTVTKEFLGTAWTGDDFTFTVTRSTADRPLVSNNQYTVLIDGVEQAETARVDGNKTLTVTVPFSEEDAETLTADTRSVKHTVAIRNLPAGTYQVTEAKDTEYYQNPTSLTVSDLELPSDDQSTATFTNTVKRQTGSLSLEKELVAAPGYHPGELPTDTKFSFTIELLEGVLTSDQTISLAYSPAAYSDGSAVPTSVTMSEDRFTVTLEANQTLTMSNLPEGRYSITEATIPSYANAFAHKENGSWVEQASNATTDGRIYTEIDVGPEAVAEVKCTNTYPVDRAELIIQKLLEETYDWDPAPGAFGFTVTLAEEDLESYSYRIYDAEGRQVGDSRTAPVTNKSFTISLEAGQYAVIPGMPVCGYTVTENAGTQPFDTSYAVYVSQTGKTASTTVNTTGNADGSGEGTAVSRTFSAGNTDAVVFTNAFQHASLTIQRTNADAGQVFVYEVKDAAGKVITVTVTGNSNTTIHGLIPGAYIVTQKNSWSWRYGDVAQEITLPAEDMTVTFSGSMQNDSWLDGNSGVTQNVYSGG